ncbi:hypothetical protein E4U53_001293 [Claviceps sorghi]|nr:hypothetical protein E4U53_001293 [Claviceps sorghi]
MGMDYLEKNTKDMSNPDDGTRAFPRNSFDLVLIISQWGVLFSAPENPNKSPGERASRTDSSKTRLH